MPQEYNFSSSFFWPYEKLVYITENVKKTKIQNFGLGENYGLVGG